jgi:hypothetical protein
MKFILFFTIFVLLVEIASSDDGYFYQQTVECEKVGGVCTSLKNVQVLIIVSLIFVLPIGSGNIFILKKLLKIQMLCTKIKKLIF